MLIKEKFK